MLIMGKLQMHEKERNKKFVSLTDVLTKDKAFSNLRKTVLQSDVISEFHNIFPHFNKTVKPVNVYKGTLYLEVENSVLKNELFLQRNLISKKINEHFHKNIIKNIKFKSF